MGARQKLNANAVTAALVVAGIVGLITESAAAFAIAFVCLIALNLHSGKIRIDRRR